MNRSRFYSLLLCCCLITPVFAESGLTPGARLFDFWVGEWDTEMANSEMANYPAREKKTGTDSVTAHLGGRLLEEVFLKGDNGENFQRGYLFYLARDGKWQHVIYDQKWGQYVFEGGLRADGTVVLESPEHDTRPGKRRETFSNVSDAGFDYRWDESYDGGKTWQVRWTVNYKRRTVPG
jgi:hypothetical protein